MENFNEIKYKLNEFGWVKIENIYDPDLIKHCNSIIDSLLPKYIDLQKKKKIYHLSENTLHHICIHYPELVDLIFSDKIYNLLEKLFNGKIILNCFGASIISNSSSTYTQKIHRDARDINSSKDMLNLVILLTKSTRQNGATYLLENSHKSPVMTPPSDKEYFDNATQITGNAGDLIIFNPYLWHSSGINHSVKERRVFTPIVTRPFIKPGLDYVRALGDDFFISCNDKLKQLFGYNSRTPKDLNEFYAVDEDRFFKRDQK